MTKREAAIITAYTGILVGKFEDFHEYAESLKGHGILNICFGDESYMNEIKELAKNDFMNLSNNLTEDKE